MKPKKESPRQFELSKLTNSSQSNVKDKKLSEGFEIPMRNVSEHIKTKEVVPQLSGNEFQKNIAEKLAKSQALRNISKKVMGVVPFAGASYAALQGDSAMAAEELAGDIPVLGQAYEAIKPETAGNRDEERFMLNEHNARVNYDNSPAHLARLKALQGFGK